jgi:hypothetical protein
VIDALDAVEEEEPEARARAATVRTAAVFVPRCSALDEIVPEASGLVLTVNAPAMAASMPNAAIAAGRAAPAPGSRGRRTRKPASAIGSDDRAGVGLEQVRAHSGDVADVVADVVRDRRGVAGVVLGDAGLDLADEVGADVRGLGVDAAADTGEQRDRGRAQRVGGDNLEGLVHLDHLDEEDVAASANPSSDRPATLKPITAPPRKASGNASWVPSWRPRRCGRSPSSRRSCR